MSKQVNGEARLLYRNPEVSLGLGNLLVEFRLWKRWEQGANSRLDLANGEYSMQMI